MKKRTFCITLLSTMVLTMGFTFTSFSEEIDVMNENGKFVETLDIPNELDGREFMGYVQNSNMAIYGQETEVLYEYDEYLYDVYTLSPVSGGWYKYGKFSNPWDEDYFVWMYAIPSSGYLIRNSWILDNGNVYLTNSQGLTRHGVTVAFKDVADTTDVIFNVQTSQWDALPFTQVGNSNLLALPYNMNITYDSFIQTLSGESYAKWKAEQSQKEQTQQQTPTESTLDWFMFDIYVPQAMSDRGFYSYEIVSRERIENNFNGVGIYKVKVPDGRSHSTKYLRVYINADGSYWKSGF